MEGTQLVNRLRMRQLLFFFLLCIPGKMLGQLTNGDFETWSSGAPYLWETANLTYMYEAIQPDTDAHTGSLSARGQVVNYNARPYAPYLANPVGSVGFLLTSQCDTMSAWYKTSLLPGDRFYGNIILYDALQYPIAKGEFAITNSVTGWTQLLTPIQYYGAGTAVYGAMYFTITDSSGTASGQMGSYFLLDDLEVQ